MNVKYLLWGITLLLLAALFVSLPAQLLPAFYTGSRIQANGTDMRADTYASVPCVVDWNEDGKKDLLVGCFYYGNVYLYLNSGTNSEPIFTTGTMLQANGITLAVGYG